MHLSPLFISWKSKDVSIELKAAFSAAVVLFQASHLQCNIEASEAKDLTTGFEEFGNCSDRSTDC